MPTTEGKLSQEEFIKAIEGMSVLELSELVKGLETRFGVTAAAPVAVAATPAAGGPAVAAEGKTAVYGMPLSAPAGKKNQGIQGERGLASPGLQGGRELLEGAAQ